VTFIAPSNNFAMLVDITTRRRHAIRGALERVQAIYFSTNKEVNLYLGAR